jgi:hypothetical protein
MSSSVNFVQRAPDRAGEAMMKLFVTVASVLMLMSFAGEARSQTDSHAGVGVKVGTLGIGFDGAVPVADRVNVRAGVNFFNFNHDFDNEGITLAAQLKLRSVHAQVDLFPFAGGFRVSPGLMLYNGNRVEATAFVPAGMTFDLGDEQLISNPSNPINGNATIGFKKVAPIVTLGWGNIVPRGSRRWSIPVELGVVFSSAPAASLSLGGSACLQNGSNCRNIASDPTLQADVREQEATLNDDLSMLKMIPVISFGFGYRF